MKANKPLLTISILISNRPDTVPKCLDSLHLIMDKIPCELILIDTSKSEEIHKLLLKYTDKVYEFEWCKDFAKARNEGIRHAKGEWLFSLDDDEWLVEVDGLLDFFRSGIYKKCEYANIQIRNFTSVDYSTYTDGWISRLFYLGGGAKYVGKVHEYMHPIHGNPAFLQAKVYHSGYIYDTEEKRQQHFERNKRLLIEEMEKEPNNLRWIAQLVQEYKSVYDWESIVSLCKKEIRSEKQLDSFMARNHFCTLYAGLVEALTNLKQNKAALEICQLGLEDERSTELLRFLLHFYAAINCLEIKDYAKANEHVCKYFEGHQYFEKNKEHLNEQLGALLIHSVFDAGNIERASNILIYLTLKKENVELSFSAKGMAKKTEMDLESAIKFVKTMVAFIASTEYKVDFSHFLSNMAQSLDICKLACIEAIELENKYAEKFQKVVHEFSKVESNFWYICYCRILEADMRGNRADVEAAVEAMLEGLDIVCHLPDRVYEVVDKYDIKIALLWNKVAGEKWAEHAKALVYNCKDIYIDKAYDYLLDVYEEDDWHVTDLVSALQEKLLLIQQNEEMNRLRAQVLEQVNVLKAAGREQEAEQILAQLEQMFS